MITPCKYYLKFKLSGVFNHWGCFKNAELLSHAQTWKQMRSVVCLLNGLLDKGDESQALEPRSKSPHTWSSDLQQRRQEYTMGKWRSLQHMVLGKLGIQMQKNKTGPYITLFTKINSKCITDLNVTPETDELVKKLGYIHTMKYYLKRIFFLKITWVNHIC